MIGVERRGRLMSVAMMQRHLRHRLLVAGRGRLRSVMAGGDKGMRAPPAEIAGERGLAGEQHRQRKTQNHAGKPLHHVATIAPPTRGCQTDGALQFAAARLVSFAAARTVSSNALNFWLCVRSVAFTIAEFMAMIRFSCGKTAICWPKMPMAR